MDAPVKTIVANAANEGIPVCAIARIVSIPSADVYEVLNDLKAVGTIAEVPKADWPPGSRVADRAPLIPLPSDDDLGFICKKTFKLTALEAGFLVVLLKHRQVQKTQLHNIVEHQRATRQAQPSTTESTDPKMVDVMICKLRKKLKSVDAALKIETIWGGGYYIEPAVKPKILAHVNGEPHEPPQKEPRTEPDPSLPTVH
jgi:DNA-binding winged helix-turn-helix (wHTH) protein